MVSLTAAARCHGCDWTTEGKPADVDKAAGRHVKAGHPVATVMRPAGHGDSISGD